MRGFEPKIVVFTCSFGWGYLTDRGILARRIRNWIPVACSGKIDSTHILRAFRSGADGVLILGCVEGDCHFQDGNYQTRKKVHLLHRVLPSFGIDPRRLRMELSVDPSGTSISTIIDDLAMQLQAIGPISCELHSDQPFQGEDRVTQ